MVLIRVILFQICLIAIKKVIFKSKKIGKNKINLSNVFFEPLVVKNKIFFSDYSGNIYNYSINDKKLLWKFNFYKKKIQKLSN